MALDTLLFRSCRAVGLARMARIVCATRKSPPSVEDTDTGQRARVPWPARALFVAAAMVLGLSPLVTPRDATAGVPGVDSGLLGKEWLGKTDWEAFPALVASIAKAVVAFPPDKSQVVLSVPCAKGGCPNVFCATVGLCRRGDVWRPAPSLPTEPAEERALLAESWQVSNEAEAAQLSRDLSAVGCKVNLVSVASKPKKPKDGDTNAGKKTAKSVTLQFECLGDNTGKWTNPMAVVQEVYAESTRCPDCSCPSNDGLVEAVNNAKGEVLGSLARIPEEINMAVGELRTKIDEARKAILARLTAATSPFAIPWWIAALVGLAVGLGLGLWVLPRLGALWRRLRWKPRRDDLERRKKQVAALAKLHVKLELLAAEADGFETTDYKRQLDLAKKEAESLKYEIKQQANAEPAGSGADKHCPAPDAESIRRLANALYRALPAPAVADLVGDTGLWEAFGAATGVVDDVLGKAPPESFEKAGPLTARDVAANGDGDATGLRWIEAAATAVKEHAKLTAGQVCWVLKPGLTVAGKSVQQPMLVVVPPDGEFCFQKWSAVLTSGSEGA